MAGAEHEDSVKIVDIPRLILIKSGKRKRNKNNSVGENLTTEDEHNPAATKLKTAVTLPPINGHLHPNQEVQDKKTRMIKLWMKLCHQPTKVKEK